MDNEIAKRLVTDGGTFILLGVPPGTEFGIDMNVFRVGEKFRGIKMIPPGFHFIFYSTVSKEQSIAPRTGFFHWFNSGEILAKKWNVYNEDIDDEEIPPDEMERLASNLRGDLDRYLGCYPYETWRKWVSLTNHVTKELMERIQPEKIKIYAVAQLQSLVYPPPVEVPMEVECSKTRKKKTEEEKLLPDMKHLPGTQIRFTQIPEQRYPDGSTPTEITQHSLDSTFLLESIMKGKEMLNVLGEMQLSFICFLLGQVYDAFEQWKDLVRLIATCDVALDKYPRLYNEFISVLHFHLKEIPADFFVDIVSSQNFLTLTLSLFFRNLQSSHALEDLKSKGERFKNSLTKNYDWDFDGEDEEEAPVVVETNEIQVVEEIEQ